MTDILLGLLFCYHDRLYLSSLFCTSRWWCIFIVVSHCFLCFVTVAVFALLSLLSLLHYRCITVAHHCCFCFACLLTSVGDMSWLPCICCLCLDSVCVCFALCVCVCSHSSHLILSFFSSILFFILVSLDSMASLLRCGLLDTNLETGVKHSFSSRSGVFSAPNSGLES